MTTINRETGEPIEPIGYRGKGLDFELAHVPERPGYRWDAYQGRRLVKRGWTRTKVGAYVAMTWCGLRWKIARPGDTRTPTNDGGTL